MSAAALLDEPARLAALHRLEILDTAPEEAFENIVSLVRAVFHVPIAVVTLVAEDRQWFKAQRGLTCSQTPRDVSFCTHTIRQAEPLVIADAAVDPFFAANPLVTGDPHIRSYAGAPLTTHEGYNVGALCAIDTKPRPYTAAEIVILQNFANIVVNELELRRIAQRDQLTGALSRRGFLDQAEQEIERYRRYQRPSSLAMVDIDHFKHINDTHGHPAGDAVLRSFVSTLSLAARPNDIVGRVGGEEFCILLPETGPDDALLAAERFRRAIEQSAFAIDGPTPLHVTASFGIATIDHAIVSAESWIARADLPLYASKRGGRNRCTLAGPRADGDTTAQPDRVAA